MKQGLNEMKYYDLPASPNARRVRIFMAEKGLDIPTKVVDMMAGENQTADYLAKNSLGKMPLLELDDGSYLAESAAICRYLEELHPEPNLFGNDAKERAEIEMWHRRAELEIVLPMIGVFTNSHPMWEGRLLQVKEWGEVCRKNLEEKMVWLNAELEAQDYLAGDRYTVADIAAQCGFVMGKAALKLPIPDDLKNLSAWFARVASRPTARA